MFFFHNLEKNVSSLDEKFPKTEELTFFCRTPRIERALLEFL